MALSNMLREPRRELTEQVLGTTAIAIPAIILWPAAKWAKVHDPTPNDIPVIIYVIVVAFVLALTVAFIWIVMLGIHTLGEWVAGKMEDMGWDPRPKRRY